MVEETFDLKHLCDLTGVSSRTIHYYIQQGLLPHSGTYGPGAKYERRHLNRLLLVTRLKGEYLPLAEIRKRLEVLTDDEVEEALREGPVESRPQSQESALDYVRNLLSKGEARSGGAQDMLQQLRSATAGMKPPVGWDRSQWERIALTPDIELHVRRPLTREGNKRLERLIEEARRILKEGGK